MTGTENPPKVACERGERTPPGDGAGRHRAGLAMPRIALACACLGGQACSDLWSDDDPVPHAPGERDSLLFDAALASDAGHSASLDARTDAERSDAAAALPPAQEAGPHADAAPDVPANPPADLSSCPAPPPSAPKEAVEAWIVVNEMRVAAGAGCMNMAAALNASALAHCDYYAANNSHAGCIADVHGELASCTGFTGADVMAREIAAGYPEGSAYTEVMTFYGHQPESAVTDWISSVWHRIPLLDPWTTEMGYGAASGCDAIDIGHGENAVRAGTIVVFPYDGQSDVSLTFDGSRESPAPPAPPSGWPSSYPISLYADQLSVTEHVLTRDGAATPLEHVWLDANSSTVPAGFRGYLANTAFLYGAPFLPDSKYHVKIRGRHSGGALALDWTFTTGSR